MPSLSLEGRLQGPVCSFYMDREQGMGNENKNRDSL